MIAAAEASHEPAHNLRTRRIVWRVKVDGFRADHMAISPDGRRLLVSASTARVVDVTDTRRGRIVGRFPSGDHPQRMRMGSVRASLLGPRRPASGLTG